MTAPANKTPLSVDYTSRDYYSLREQLILRVKDRVPGWNGNDSSDFGLALIEAFAYMGDLTNYYIDRTANEAFILTATQRDTLLNISKMYGYSPSNYVGSVVDVDFTNNNGYKGAVGAAIIETSPIDGVSTTHLAKIVVPNDHPFIVNDMVIVESFTTKATGVIAGVTIDYDTSVFNGTFKVLETGYDNIGNNVLQYRPEATVKNITVNGTKVTVEYEGSIRPSIGQKINLSGITVPSGNNYNGNWFVENSTEASSGVFANLVFDSAKHVAKVTKVYGDGTNIRFSTFGNASTSLDIYGYTTPSWHVFTAGQKVTTTGINPTAYNLTGATVASVKDSLALITNITTNGSGTVTVVTSKPFEAKDIISIRNIRSLNNPNGDPNTTGSATNWNLTDVQVAVPSTTTATISNVVGNKTTGVTQFTTSGSGGHGFTTGQYVTITGMDPDVYNLEEVKITSVPSTTTFTVNSYWDDVFVSGGTATRYSFTVTGSTINTTESVSSTGTIGAVLCKQFVIAGATTTSYVSGGTATALVGGTPTVTNGEVTFADLPVIINPGGTVKDLGGTTVPAGSQLYAQVSNADGTQNVIFSTQEDLHVPYRSTTTALVVQGEQVAYRADNAAVGSGDISGELLGYSSGEAVQMFDLKEVRVNSSTVQIFVDNGTDFEEWTQVPHIMDYGPSDKVFEVYTSGSGTVTAVFGDGISGKIPTKESGIKAKYFAGGGTVGNVSAGTITSWGVIPAGIDPEADVRKITITNPDAANGGLDPESNDSIRYNAPRALRSLNRAVTLQDFTDLALSVDRVAKANAIGGSRNSVTIYMAPISTDTYPGVIGEDTTSQWKFIQNNINLFLQDKVQIGTTVTVLPPRYSDVGLTITYTKGLEFSASVVESSIKKSLLEEFAYDNLQFADVITPEELEFKLRQVDGVVNAKVDYFGRMSSEVTTSTMADWFGRDSLVGEPDELFVFSEDNIVLFGASSDASLSAVTITPSPSGSATWTTTFQTGVYSYRVTVPNGTTSVAVTATATDTSGEGGLPKITTNGASVASGSARTITGIDVGNTPVTIVVTAGDGVTVKVYKVTITRAA